MTDGAERNPAIARLVALEQAVLALVKFPADQGGLATVPEAVVARLADPRDRVAMERVPASRLLVYRRLVRATLMSAVRAELPLSSARFGLRLDRWVERFCDEELPRSPVLREVAFEFVRWALPRWAASDDLPPWAGDLARFELLEFDAHCAERRSAALAGTELAAEQAVAFDGSVRLGRFRWAVAGLVDDPAAEPPARPHGVLFHRDADNEVRRNDLEPTATLALRAMLLEGAPLAKAVRDALGVAATFRATIDALAVTLEGLAASGALLGATTSPLDLRGEAWADLVDGTEGPPRAPVPQDDPGRPI